MFCWYMWKLVGSEEILPVQLLHGLRETECGFLLPLRCWLLASTAFWLEVLMHHPSHEIGGLACLMPCLGGH